MAASMASHRTSDQSRSVANAKVLLVEDCQDLDYSRLILEQQGCEVRTCGSLVEGIRFEPYDFVVVCQGSLRFEGRPVLERAINIDRYRPVLVLTRSHDMSCYLGAMQLGAVDHFGKLVRPVDVAHVIKIHSRTYHNAGRPTFACGGQFDCANGSSPMAMGCLGPEPMAIGSQMGCRVGMEAGGGNPCADQMFSAAAPAT